MWQFRPFLGFQPCNACQRTKPRKFMLPSSSLRLHVATARYSGEHRWYRQSQQRFLVRRPPHYSATGLTSQPRTADRHVRKQDAGNQWREGVSWKLRLTVPGSARDSEPRTLDGRHAWDVRRTDGRFGRHDRKTWHQPRQPMLATEEHSHGNVLSAGVSQSPLAHKQERQNAVQPNRRPQERPDPFTADAEAKKIERCQ